MDTEQHLKPQYKLQNGKYTILQTLGQGGFGISYKAQMKTYISGELGKLNIKVEVAIKEFFFQQSCTRHSTSHEVTTHTNQDFVHKLKDKFIKEAQILSQLQHPYIVKVLEVFEANNTAYTVMEFLEGESLGDLLKKEGKLSLEHSLRYIEQVLQALAFIHQQKILHLDIKPDNILLNSEDSAVLIDFGISKRYDDTGNATSTFIGAKSKGYAPFEQYSDGEMDIFKPATDLYAVGATLYRCLTGERPPEATTLITNDLVSAHTLDASIPLYISEVIDKAMRLKPQERFQSATEMWHALSTEKKPNKEAETIVDVPPIVAAETIVNTSQAKPKAQEQKTYSPKEVQETKNKNPFPFYVGAVLLFLIILFVWQPWATDNKELENNTEIAKNEEPKRMLSTALQALESSMVSIRSGTFMMGSPASEAGRYGHETQHQVTLSGFKMSKYEVTQAQWLAIMGSNPSSFKDCDNCPVEKVSWNDIQEFLRKLNALTGKNYRLPTEAEWEYACRAGTTTPFSTGNNLSTAQANYDGNYPYNGNAKGVYRQKTTPVGSFSPNAWGLYDMHGNVWEWCSDWYGDYPTSAQSNPKGPSNGSDRVLRGGSWFNDARDCRSAFRAFYAPAGRYDDSGFRLASS
jgi:formylglycine-generating enzyme required for sulfatase activity/predicted Ser/Thr protein kinase